MNDMYQFETPVRAKNIFADLYTSKKSKDPFLCWQSEFLKQILSNSVVY